MSSDRFPLTREQIEMVLFWKSMMDSEFKISSDPRDEHDALEEAMSHWLDNPPDSERINPA